IVSAYGDMSNIRAAMNRGAFDFVTKPIDFADLEKTIAKTVRHIEFLREARQRQVAAERAYASLSRYFSPNLAKQLASDTDAIALCGRRREIATVFSDITGFYHAGGDARAGRPGAAAQRLSDEHDGYRLRPRRHGGKNCRRCLAYPIRSARRAARPRRLRSF